MQIVNAMSNRQDKKKFLHAMQCRATMQQRSGCKQGEKYYDSRKGK
mgnify:FL=1